MNINSEIIARKMPSIFVLSKQKLTLVQENQEGQREGGALLFYQC